MEQSLILGSPFQTLKWKKKIIFITIKYIILGGTQT